MSEAIVGGTQLTFVHRLAAEPYDATSSGPGWHYYMDRLSAHLEGSEPTEDWSAYELLGPQYALPRIGLRAGEKHRSRQGKTAPSK